MSHEVPSDEMQCLLFPTLRLASLEKPIKGHLVCLQAWPGACCPGAQRTRGCHGISFCLPGARSGTLGLEVGDDPESIHLGSLTPQATSVLPLSPLA